MSDLLYIYIYFFFNISIYIFLSLSLYIYIYLSSKIKKISKEKKNIKPNWKIFCLWIFLIILCSLATILYFILGQSTHTRTICVKYTKMWMSFLNIPVFFICISYCIFEFGFKYISKWNEYRIFNIRLERDVNSYSFKQKSKSILYLTYWIWGGGVKLI